MTTAPAPDLALELRDIEMRFAAATPVLIDVNFALEPGVVHAIVVTTAPASHAHEDRGRASTGRRPARS